MVSRRQLAPRGADLDFGAIRTELEVPEEFPPDVLDAAQVAASAPRLPSHDATDLPLVTVDPPGSRDLDQALAIEGRPGGGWRVRYAIADVGAWVSPGDALDAEARRRTQTFYSPDGRTPLHPPALGEAAASLLPDGPRPAALWTIDVAPDGTTAGVDLHRAMVRSRAQLTYAEVQTAFDAGRPPEPLSHFAALGEALLADARRRDAIELGLPEQEVVAGDGGHWTVALRAELAVERWNAQVSLLTGRCAAAMMIDGGIGVLRTLPSPDPATFPRLRSAARNLGIDWPDGAHPGDVLASLDVSTARHAAFADLAAELLRGAGYTVLDGEPPTDPGHAGVGAPYAHVTAPLRRLVDRFTTETCLALAAGTAVPAWVSEALPTLPELMSDGDRRARALDRATVDATEAFVLRDRIGDRFEASVMESGERFGTIVLADPPVRARCQGRDLPLGVEISARLIEADVSSRKVTFESAS